MIKGNPVDQALIKSIVKEADQDLDPDLDLEISLARPSARRRKLIAKPMKRLLEYATNAEITMKKLTKSGNVSKENVNYGITLW